MSSTLSDSTEVSQVLLTNWHGDHTGGVPDLIRLYPHLSESIFKNGPDRGQQPIVDSQVFRVEGATVRAVHSTGHSHDHMCFIPEEENAMFTGDNVLGHGTSAVELLGTWMASLQLMDPYYCERGYPAHGDIIHNLSAKVAGELGQKARAREKQGERDTALQELVTAMYGNNLDEQVRAMALEPLFGEVLVRLAEDGRVTFEVRRGVKRWFAIHVTSCN